MSGPRIWINAFEPSGDMHGGLLAGRLKALRPDITLAGMGGPAMEREGVALGLRLEGPPVMGISEVFSYLPRIFDMWRTIRKRLHQERPMAVVLIDAPDFHFQVARMAHGLGIPVFYYISPQVWAWRPGRVEFLKKHVRRMLCILPFEQDFYRARGMAAEYVGHPLVEQVRRSEFLRILPKQNRIGILPGSRKNEIERLMPVFAETTRLLRQHDPRLAFVVIKAPGVSESYIRQFCPDDLGLTFLEADQRYHHMRECVLLLAASGTVTLESSLLGVPTIVAYKCSRVSFLIAVRLVKVPAISLVNLILKGDVLPEFIQGQATPENLADKAWAWLHHPSKLDSMRNKLAVLPELLGTGNALENAARIILREMDRETARA